MCLLFVSKFYSRINPRSFASMLDWRDCSWLMTWPSMRKMWQCHRVSRWAGHVSLYCDVSRSFPALSPESQIHPDNCLSALRDFLHNQTQVTGGYSKFLITTLLSFNPLWQSIIMTSCCPDDSLDSRTPFEDYYWHSKGVVDKVCPTTTLGKR